MNFPHILCYHKTKGLFPILRGLIVEVTKGFIGGYPLLVIKGLCDFDSVMELSDVARHHFRVGKKQFYIDLSDLTGVDSLLFGFFISLHISIKDTGEKLIFLNPSKEVSEVFQMSNVEKILNIEINENVEKH